MTRSERMTASGINPRSEATFAEQMAGLRVNMTNMHPDLVRYVPPMDYWRWYDGSISTVYHQPDESGAMQRFWRVWKPRSQR